MVTTTQARATHEEVDAYVRRCGFFLGDLPIDVQRSLEHDIYEIVLEVTAELDGDPVDLIGAPMVFVTDLRSSAGLPPHRDVNEVAAEAEPLKLIAIMRDWVRSVARPWCKSLAGDLRPAWWVLRGLGLALVLDPNHLQNGNGLMPNLFGWNLPWLIVAACSVVLSVRVGEAGRPVGVGRRAVLAVLGAVALLLVLQDVATIRDASFRGDFAVLAGDVMHEGGMHEQQLLATDDGAHGLASLRVYDDHTNQLLMSSQGSISSLLGVAAGNEYQVDVSNGYRVELGEPNGNSTTATVRTWEAVADLVRLHINTADGRDGSIETQRPFEAIAD